MLFDTSEFALFFASFLLLYYLVRGSIRLRNALIVAASFAFYGAWRVKFLLLLIATATFDFLVALQIARSTQARAKTWLIASLAANLGVLAFFKYCNFFAESLRELLAIFGPHLNTGTLDILLPIGISFYTFQSMAYVIDVYRRQIAPSRNWFEFIAFISFFPQLVAGPIERAAHLLPQFQTARVITREHIKNGIALTIFGLFKKIVIADNLAAFVLLAYDHPEPGAALLVAGSAAFALQIYCDFSGYSDIARGTALLLGFDLMKNFNLPYFATSLSDFWQRWHISLSTWFRDYLYVPLGGNRRGLWRTCVNLFVVMLLAGLWHGAKGTFLFWGAWHAIGLILQKLWVHFKPANLKLPRALAWAVTMAWILYGWMLFRAQSIDDVYRYTAALQEFTAPAWMHLYIRNLAILTAPLVAFQLWQRIRRTEFPLGHTIWRRAAFHAALIMAVLVFSQREEIRPFIYFQF